MRVMGVDPGLTRAAWGLVEVKGTQIRYLASGCIPTSPSMDLDKRLHILYASLLDILMLHKPLSVGFEETFINSNATSSLKLGLARGALISAVGAYKSHMQSQGEVSVAYYPPNQIKKAVTGQGHADKKQMQQMIQRLLPTACVTTHDEADALAIAMCEVMHASWRQVLS